MCSYHEFLFVCWASYNCSLKSVDTGNHELIYIYISQILRTKKINDRWFNAYYSYISQYVLLTRIILYLKLVRACTLCKLNGVQSYSGRQFYASSMTFPSVCLQVNFPTLQRPPSYTFQSAPKISFKYWQTISWLQIARRISFAADICCTPDIFIGWSELCCEQKYLALCGKSLLQINNPNDKYAKNGRFQFKYSNCKHVEIIILWI